jgi:sugar phosphate isomerase/epimerase
MNTSRHYSRRNFLGQATLAASGLVVAGQPAFAQSASNRPPISVFSKIYQELKLDFDQAAALTADAGLDGIDCPVRPGGEIEPAQAAEQMPRYADALKRREARMLLLTTAILSPATPYTTNILRTAAKLGVRYYRLGQVQLPKDEPGARKIAEVRAGLKELAQLNRDMGVTAIFQNHSPGTGRNRYLGGDLDELLEVVQGFNPEEIGVAFDLGHALVVHGREWKPRFEKLKPYVKVAYVKDAKIGGRFVHFGQGDFAASGWFTLLKDMGYKAPYSVHIEFDWSNPDKTRNRQALLNALIESRRVLEQWISAA